MSRNKNRESIFHFKQFSISNCRSAMKVGTDSVLVGSLCGMPQGECSILDIGTGCGVIALMLAQRNPKAKITAIEIDPDAADEARDNFHDSKFADQISILTGDITRADIPQKFDLIVSNPPYFSEDTHSPDANRAKARHDNTLPLDDLMTVSCRLLKPEGRLCFIYPSQRDVEVEFSASIHKCPITRQLRIFSKTGNPAVRTIWELSKNSQSPRATAIENMTIRDKDGTPTEQYVNAVKDFYIKIS